MIAIVTPDQAKELRGQWYAPDSYFNPCQLKDGDWFISQEEIDQNENEDFPWVEDLLLINFTDLCTFNVELSSLDKGDVNNDGKISDE